MRYLHTMVRVKDLDASLHFYCDLLGLQEVRRVENEKGRFTLVFLAAPKNLEQSAVEARRVDNEAGRYTLVFLAADEDEHAGREANAPLLELTYNWDTEDYQGGRNFGHLAYKFDDVYAACQRLMDGGVTINRPPRDGNMAFVRSPDGISIELLQEGEPLAPAEPWTSMPNTGTW